MTLSRWAFIGLTSTLLEGVAGHGTTQHIDVSASVPEPMELNAFGEEYGFEVWREDEEEVNDAHLDQPRVLAAGDDFVYQSDCVPDSCDTATAFSALGDQTEIACGICVYMDVGGEINLDGLNIIGKLQFREDHADVTINTPYVVVQGELEILSNKVVSPTNKGVKFFLTGETDLSITPHGDNADKCGGPCPIGKKAFIVAGGKLSITAIPSTCATWSKITDIKTSDVRTPQEGELPQQIRAPEGCSDPVLTAETFDNSFGNDVHWSGGLGTYVHHEGNTTSGLVVGQRATADQGPFADISMLKSCILPDVHYVFNAKVKLNRDPSDAGQPTTCKLSGENCLKLKIGYQKSNLDKYSKTKGEMYQIQAPDYSEEVLFGASFTFTETELSTDNIYLIMYISGPEAGVEIVLEEFELTLPKADSYPDPADACADLALGGDGSLNGNAPYPMFTYSGNEDLYKAEEDGNKFYRLTGRTKRWDGFHQDFPSVCAQALIMYDFSMRIRLHSDTKEVAYAEIDRRNVDGSSYGDSVRIVTCAEQSIDDGWRICSDTIAFDGSLVDTPKLELNIRMQGDENQSFDMDIGDVQFTPKQGPLDTLVIDNTNGQISDCWGAGSEVLLTSQTRTWDDDEVRTIESVTPSPDGTLVHVVLDSAIYPVSVLNDDDPNASVFAGEVALLTRNVIVEGDNTVNADQGGYLTIYRTPDVQQTIEGVEFTKMGQQGLWDRYPIHFEQCKSAGDGSKVSMNAIRDSFQRCVVLEGTNNAIISKNVAYNTKGYCYHLEDRTEINNLFEYNLGARTGPPTLPLESKEKDDVATFFCANPNNHWIGNVAAGSHDRGFNMYFESKTRGESASLYEGDSPRETAIGTFQDNIAHSNYRGVYVYRLYEPSTFSNVMSYRNSDGFTSYAARNFVLEGGVFADNRMQAFFDRTDNFQVSGSTVRGFTQLNKAMLDKRVLHGDSNVNKLCPSSTVIKGFKIPTKLESHGRRGMTLNDVSFSDFDTAVEGGCSSNSAPFNYDDGVSDMHFAYPSSLQGVTINDSRPGLQFDKCDSVGLRGGKDVDDIVITDVDSSFNPDTSSTFNGVSSIVSNQPYMLTFAVDSGANCVSSESECVAYCENLCLRTVDLFVDMYGTESWELVVKKSDDPSVNVTIPGHSNLWYNGAYWHHRRFSASLPSGLYVAEFQDEGGNVVWPRYVEERWDTKPDCGDYPSAGDVTFNKPDMLDRVCDDLIMNGQMEGSYDPWTHNGGGIEFDLAAGVDGTGAIITEKRSKTYYGLGQYLDTHCVETSNGQQYEFSAKVKLVDSDLNTVTCDPNIDSGSVDQCPELYIKKYYGKDASKEKIDSNYRYPLAEVVRSYVADDFVLFHGLFAFDESWYSNSDAYYIYADGKHKTGINMILDEVSLTPFQSSCSGNIVLNNNFSTGDSRYWNTYDEEPFLQIVEGKGGIGDYALKAFNRGSDYYNSIRQDLPMGCLTEGERYLVHAEYRLEKNNARFDCDPSSANSEIRCLEFDIKSYDSQGDEHKNVALTSAPVNENGWNYIVGTFLATNKMSTADEKVTFFFDRLDPSVDIIINEVSITHLPLDCSNLIMNSDFENGRADHWKDSSMDGSRTDIVAGYDSAYAVRNYERTDVYHGLQQLLDLRCMVPGDEYVISGMFKLQKDGNPVGCDPTEFDETDTACPSVVVYGDYCDGSDTYERYYNELILPWDSDSFNKFESKFMVDNALATCDKVFISINRVNTDYDIIVDNFKIQHSSVTRAPNTAPTVPAYTNPPASSPTTNQPSSSMAPTQTAVDCGLPSDEPMNITHGAVFLTKTSPGVLCTLTKRTFVEGVATSIVPLARSYDGNDWETAAGEFAFDTFVEQKWNCYSGACGIHIPDILGSDEEYVLASYEYGISQKDEVARLLEGCTFGTTKELIDSWDYVPPMEVSMASWVEEQMAEEMTSHREFWRERGNQRVPRSFDIGMPDHPCDPLSRWRKYTFTRWDRSRDDAMFVNLEVVPLNGTSGPYLLKTNGHPRTVVDDIQFRKSEYSLNTNHIYEICNWPYPPSVKYPRGRLFLRTESGSCQEVDRSNANPLVDLTAASAYLTGINVLQIPNTTQIMPISEDFTDGEEYILVDGLTDPSQQAICDSMGLVIESDDSPVFAQLSDGTWLQFDPRLRLEENTVTSPILDGGGSNYMISAEETLCSNVPRTFLNKDSCILSSESTACGAIPPAGSEFTLDETNLLKIHDLTGRYVYEIQGLPVKDHLGDTIDHPCTADLRSRWEITAGNCPAPHTDSQVVSALLGVFSTNGDTNPHIRDITFPASGTDCGAYDSSDVEIQIQNGEDCWTHKHPDHRSVYDMTYWTRDDTHIGNQVAMDMNRPNPIKKWIDEDGSATLHFPAYHPTLGSTFNHDEGRWEMNVAHFTYVGRFGDTMQFRDLPNELRLEAVSEYYSTGDEQSGEGVIVCGSPGEVSNNPYKEDIFPVSVHEDWDVTSTGDLKRQKHVVWTMVVLSAKDQLRQRMAYALSQILVVAIGAIDSRDRNTEIFLGYYDIFVRHAFGNYRDILKEISYSPLMAENLSFLESKSHAYNMDKHGQNSFADENFAREIMQLFSTGFYLLNLDGTQKLDSQGNPISAYTNSHIMSFARGWTGFDLQRKRGNTEERENSGNRIDPMKVWADWRDRFPKIDMQNGYIGDRYALCEDMPSKMFLEKGATYRLLGSSSLPELVEDDDKFESDDTIKRIKLDTNSSLYSALCEEESGKCQFSAEVVLSDTHDCIGDECFVDTLRVVEVVSGIFYEYIRPPCVELPFFNDAKKLNRKKRSWGQSVCGNPRLPTASEACCPLPIPVGKKYAQRNQIYDGERMTYATAEQRCLSIGRALCDYTEIDIDKDYKAGFHWTPDACEIRVKINPDGNVAIVYEMQTPSSKVSWIDDNNLNFFEVRWDNDSYPNSSNNCGDGKCDALQGGGCLCQTAVFEDAMFDSMPATTASVLSSLSIGAFDPSTYEVDEYTDITSDGSGITAYHKGGDTFGKDTIFEVTDGYGRRFFLKNVRSTVRMESLFGETINFSFRNPPNFMSLIPIEATVRDAQYETEAILDDYLYHPNTAPFLCLRFIQRFGISNPAPRYVESCATAFQQGFYSAAGKTFGSREYGCLNATVASIVLDREARSVVLDADPSQGSIREPLLKVIGLMRNMELQREDHVRKIVLRDMDDHIGQMAHEFTSVFSYFLPEYQADGVLTTATLVSPEAQIFDMPRTVSLLNGLFSMVKFGLSNCNDGFGESGAFGNCHDDGQFRQASGVLKFVPSANSSTDIIDELSTIMTAGRLSGRSREIIKGALESASSPEAGLRIAQQLISTTPEFHTTNPTKLSQDSRELPQPTEPSSRPYKAVIFLMFSGGCDSFNMLTPHTCAPGNGSDDLFTQYLQVRQNVALQKHTLHPITAEGQVCDVFGVHENLPVLAENYNEGSALFFANTGALDQYSDETNYKDNSVTQLFAHNTMQRAAKKIDPHAEVRGTGVLGRLNDVLTRNGFKTSSFSIDSTSVALVGQPGLSPDASIISKNGIDEFNPTSRDQQMSQDDMFSNIRSLNNSTDVDSGFFGETWSSKLIKYLTKNSDLYDVLEATQTNVTFPDTNLGKQFEVVARMMKSYQARGVDRDLFYVQMGGYDTHSDVEETLITRFGEVNGAIGAFIQELKSMSLWNETILMQHSDFARTLVPNGGAGTDHAWGGNYFMLGGSVDGGRILGQYPEHLIEGNPYVLGRGRMVPTTAWDMIWNGISEWFGVSGDELNEVCPNRDSFPVEDLFTASDLFK